MENVLKATGEEAVYEVMKQILLADLVERTNDNKNTISIEDIRQSSEFKNLFYLAPLNY